MTEIYNTHAFERNMTVALREVLEAMRDASNYIQHNSRPKEFPANEEQWKQYYNNLFGMARAIGKMQYFVTEMERKMKEKVDE